MKLRPIRTKGDYAAALREAERLWDAPEKSRQAEQLEVLLLIEDYERRHFPIDIPDASTCVARHEIGRCALARLAQALSRAYCTDHLYI